MGSMQMHSQSGKCQPVNKTHMYNDTIIDKALEIATRAHRGQKDLDGNPVILHPLTVGLKGRNPSEIACGFLHDVVEDSGYTFEDLLKEGIPEDMVSSLMLLTHDKSVPYMDYVRNICESGDRTAIAVKLHDLQHNIQRGKRSRISRLVEKHSKALLYLVSYVIEHGMADEFDI